MWLLPPLVRALGAAAALPLALHQGEATVAAAGAPPAGCWLKVLKDVEHMHVRSCESEAH